MYIFKELCEDCGGFIEVYGYVDRDDRQEYVDHGRCQDCMKNVVLPSEPYWLFVHKFCDIVE